MTKRLSSIQNDNMVWRYFISEIPPLAGLYAGNQRRATARPTAERLLEAFEGITLTIIKGPQQTDRHVTILSLLQ